MTNALPFFRMLPIPLLAYGLARSVLEVLEVSGSLNSLTMGADDFASMRWITYAAYFRAVDSFIFYAAMAALLAIGVQLENRKP